MQTEEVQTVKWKIAELLEKNGKTAYALAKVSGLSMPTVYAIVNGEKKGVQFDVLASIMRGLEELTGKRVELSDVLEVIRDGA
jgi:DNA-binding Xre family transcriptional regulator